MECFFLGNEDDLLLSSFSHCKLNYLRIPQCTSIINCYIIQYFIKAREAKRYLTASLYFPQSHALEFESKRSVSYEQLTFPLHCFASDKNIFKILAKLFLLFMVRKEGQLTKQFFISSNQHNPPKRKMMRSLSVSRIM